MAAPTRMDRNNVGSGEVNAAAEAATAVGLPYVITCSFDTAGRTMMGLLPRSLADTWHLNLWRHWRSVPTAA